MKQNATFFFTLLSLTILAQSSPTTNPLDPRYWGVVLEHPAMKNVIVKQDVSYLKDEKGNLKIDIYSPPGLMSGELRPAIIFLNGIGENPGQPKVKSWGIYKTWPQLMAAKGFIGISMETDGDRVQESMQALFKFLSEKGNTHNINATKLGAYAASANVTQSATFLMKEDTYKGIKAAVLYYGGVPEGPYRKDLPVLFVISEGDVARNGYTTIWTEVLKNNAPWTIKMASGMPHAFDAFEDTDESRKVIKETISFWKNHLEPVEQPSWQKSLPRSILAASYGHDDVKLIPLLEQWLPDHSDDSEALYQYASALKNVRRYEEAEKAYRKVLVIEPNHVQTLTYMYLLMHTLNHPEEAEPFLVQAEKLGPINKYTYQGMGLTMYGLNKHKEGVRFFEKVVEADPSGINLYNLACGYARIGDKDNAFRTLEKAIDAGFTYRQQFDSDTDLDSLRADNRYKKLMDKISNPPVAPQAIGNVVPPLRAHHALVYDESSKRIILTSGSTPLNGGQSFKFFDDVWDFNGAKWTLGGNTGDERSGIRLVYNPNNKKIFSYGGYLPNEKSAGELRVLEGMEWKTLTDLPEMIATEAGLVYDSKRDKLIAFGGSSAPGKMLNTTWEWDGKSWKKFEGQSPESRMGFAMEYDSKRNKTFLFGGSGGDGTFFDDTWSFDGKKWMKLTVSGPSARVSPGFAYDSKRGLLILFGGVNKQGVLGDTWSWDGVAWKKLSDKGPSARVTGQLAYDKDRDHIILFGGRLGWPNDANDTWEWDGREWKEIKLE